MLYQKILQTSVLLCVLINYNRYQRLCLLSLLIKFVTTNLQVVSDLDNS